MHADTRDRKLILTAGSEKAKWKQLPRKGGGGGGGRIQERLPITAHGIKYMVCGK